VPVASVTALPPGVIDAVASAGTFPSVIEALPVAVPCGSITIV
jgi:hypothetical protein